MGTVVIGGWVYFFLEAGWGKGVFGCLFVLMFVCRWGHLAIQFASKMGAEVVVFSTSPDKRKEAKDFGTSEFVLLNELEKLSAPVNVLIVSSSKLPDCDKYFPPLLLSDHTTNLYVQIPRQGSLSQE